MAALGVHQQVLQHDALRRVFNHDHHFITTAAHRRRAFGAGLEQHGFIEGEIDDVFALHGQDAGVVALQVGGLGVGDAGGGKHQPRAGCLEFHRRRIRFESFAHGNLLRSHWRMDRLAAAYEQLYRDAMARTPAAEPVRSGA